MRKMFLSALACVAFAGSSFASNEIIYKENNSLLNNNSNDKQDSQESFKLNLENGISLTVTKVYSGLGDCSWVIIFTDSRGRIVNMQISPVYGDTTFEGCGSSFGGAMDKAIEYAKEWGLNVNGRSNWVAY